MGDPGRSGVPGYLSGLPAELRPTATTLVSLLRRAHRDARCAASSPWSPTNPGQFLAVGRRWAAAKGTLAQLVGLLGRLAEEAAELLDESPPTARRLVRTADRLLQLVVDGFCSTEPPATARQCAGDIDLRALLTGAPVSAATLAGLAPAYGVLAFHTDAPHPADAIGKLADQARASGALTIYFDHCGVMLIPADDLEQAAKHGRELCAAAAISPAWAGLDWRPLAELRAGWSTALDVLIGALASHLPPGLYQLSDVLLPCAVLRQQLVMDTLERALKPVVEQPTLHRALVAFMRHDGNRSRAAADLGVHRSTLDYRLGRIAELTGHDPQSMAGNRMFGLALLVNAARRVTEETLTELIALRPAADEPGDFADPGEVIRIIRIDSPIGPNIISE
jgi:PucR-like helix-turn-helix protein